MATSGLLLVAKQEDVFVELQRMFATRQVLKRYTALLDGVPSQSEGEISLPLAADYINRPRQMVDTLNGKHALTLYRCLKWWSMKVANVRVCILPPLQDVLISCVYTRPIFRGWIHPLWATNFMALQTNA
jgi:23S rRNA-/tRNA-specific pseudouridylate synthase